MGKLRVDSTGLLVERTTASGEAITLDTRRRYLQSTTADASKPQYAIANGVETIHVEQVPASWRRNGLFGVGAYNGSASGQGKPVYSVRVNGVVKIFIPKEDLRYTGDNEDHISPTFPPEVFEPDAELVFLEVGADDTTLSSFKIVAGRVTVTSNAAELGDVFDSQRLRFHGMDYASGSITFPVSGAKAHAVTNTTTLHDVGPCATLADTVVGHINISRPNGTGGSGIDAELPSNGWFLVNGSYIHSIGAFSHSSSGLVNSSRINTGQATHWRQFDFYPTAGRIKIRDREIMLRYEDDSSFRYRTEAFVLSYRLWAGRFN